MLGWQSGRFRYQRSVVRIQSTARFYNENIFCKLLKRQKQEKSGQEWPNKRECYGCEAALVKLLRERRAKSGGREFESQYQMDIFILIWAKNRII